MASPNVRYKNKQYDDMVPKWQRCRDVYAGSDAVKGRGVQYLPMLESQKATGNDGDASYQAYKKRALFFNATRRTAGAVAGTLVGRKPEIKVPAEVEKQLEDVTLTGINAWSFAQRVARNMATVGRHGVLVEMTSPEAPGAERVYWTEYDAEDVINWKEQRVGGDPILTLLVLRESREIQVEGDPFGVKCIKVFRVLRLENPGQASAAYSSTVWSPKNPDDAEGEYVPEETIYPKRRGKVLTFIPFTFFGAMDITPAVDDPPLLDLVDVNLSHYQTSATLEHGCHYSGLPTPYIAGAVKTSDDEILLGPGGILILEQGGTAGMLQSQTSFPGLEKREEEKRKMMAVLGARALETSESGTAETATAVSMRHAGERASLATMAAALDAGFTQVLRRHAWWDAGAGVEEPEDLDKVSWKTNRQFFDARMTPGELQALTASLQAEAISYETFYAALTRGEMTRPGVDAEEEMTAILRRPFSGGEPPNAVPNPGGILPESGNPEDEDEAELKPGQPKPKPGEEEEEPEPPAKKD